MGCCEINLQPVVAPAVRLAVRFDKDRGEAWREPDLIQTAREGLFINMWMIQNARCQNVTVYRHNAPGISIFLPARIDVL